MKRSGASLDEGSSRYVIGDRLGAGSVGVVHRARDTVRGVEVAVKTLRLPSGAHLYRFKREFRALADIVHPNLATLHALEARGDEWIIVMELVDGGEFLDWVRPRAAVAGDEWVDEETKPIAMPAAPRGPLDPGRLRAAMRQLAQGIAHLHRLDRLHRDIKPSNVLVEASGRVVLCDFGLVVERDRPAGEESHVGFLVGTPSYVSPEQAEGAPLGEASDWYSVGVMLYEALAGRLPFTGTVAEVLAQKQRAEPPPPPSRFAAVPADLEALCMALLRRDPAARPSGEEVRRALEVGPAVAPSVTPLPDRFVGRERPLAVLDAALAEQRAGQRCVAVLVQGASGTGKSRLVRRFVAEAQRHQHDLLVLEGRCFPRESVRYKTLDPLVDALSAHLLTMSREEVERAVPRDAAALVRLFPVLERVEAIAELARDASGSADPLDSRRRAFAALRGLLAALGSGRAMIVVIDDLHWGDADSAIFLESLIDEPAGVPLLLIATIAADHRVSWASGRDVRTLELGPLDADEARRLVESIVGTGAGGEAALAIVREAGGNPLLVSELARLAAAGAAPATPASLDELLTARIDALPGDAQALLATLAAAGRPISVGVAGRAAGVERPDQAVAQLCAARLVRRRAEPHAETLSIQYERIRAVMLARAGAEELARRHLGLAEVLEAGGGADPDELVEHWSAAGDRARAAELAVLAAGKAEAALAFHAAARFLELAITLRPPDDAVDLELRVRYADALHLAGRPGDAAEAYRRAADQAAAGDAARLRYRAVEQYLRAGRDVEGLALADAIMPALGLARIPPRGRRALVALIGGKLGLRMRGLRFVERSAAEVDPEDLRRADVLWSLATVLGFNDPVTGAAMQTRHLRHALRVGEVHRAARALSLELCYLSLAGAPEKAERLTPSVLSLAERIGDHNAVGVAISSIGIGAFVSGQWRRAERYLTRGRELVMSRGTGLRWELDLSNNLRLAALLNLGALRELTEAVPLAIRDAERQGNHFAASSLRAWRSNLIWLVLDDPDEAWRNADLGAPRIVEGRRNPHEYYDLISRSHIEIYRGDGEAAWRRIESYLPDLRRAMLHRFPNMAIETSFLRARAALASAAGDQRRARLAIASRLARGLRRAALPWGRACGDLITACLALAAGDREHAVDRLVSAELGFDGTDMALMREVARHARGEAMGGDAGAALIAEARRWMTSQRVADPARLAALYAPAPPGSR